MLNSEAFWRFSGELYQTLQSELLMAQDELDLNINVLLLCHYLNRHNKQLTVAQWQTLDKHCRVLCDRIEQHRRRRREAKSGPLSDYQTLLEQELALEKQHQQLLIEQVNALTPLPTGNNNVQGYLTACFPHLPSSLPDSVRWRD